MATARSIMKQTYKEFGKHIVADPRICHGKWTFRGTRIFVSHVLDQVAAGMDWKKISKEWDGCVSAEAISEAILLAKSALFSNDTEMKKSA